MDTGTIARAAGAAFLVTLLSACGGGGGGGGSSATPSTPTPTPPPPPPPPAVDNTLSSTHKPTLTGRFADTAIVGLHYSSASGSGTTDAQGQFQYQPGDLITFKIGDIALPPVVGRPQLRLTDFGGHHAPYNIARFLLGIDSDGNVDNGFDISAQAHTAGTGKTLDFDVPLYDEEDFIDLADPIVAAAGGVNTRIAAYDDAADLLDTVRGKFDPVNPVAGGWIDTNSANLRAVLFLENGMYYSMEANCNGVPGYEFGTYTYTDGNVQLAVTNDADGAACGLNSGSQAVSVSNYVLSLAGSSWQSVGGDYGYGVYYSRGALGNPTDHAFALALLGQGSFAAIDSNCAGGVSVEFGDYEAGSAIYFPPVTLVSTELTTSAINNNACSISSLFSQSLMAINGQVMADASGVAAMIEIRPSWRNQLLVGGWISKPGNGITFTSDGRYIYTTTDPSCLAAPAQSGGEKGTYSWDTVDSTAALNVGIDTDGSCGYANLAGGANSGIDKLRVDGNLLTISSGGRQDVLVRNTAAEWGGWSGLWTRRQAAGASLMTINVDSNGSFGQDLGDYVSVTNLDSDCTRADSFSLELIQLLVDPHGDIGDVIFNTNSGPLADSTDKPGCGLSDVVGPTYEFNGDTLTIDGWGTFVREL